MGAAITHGTGVITPLSMPEYEDSSEARTITHPILGREDDDVTFRPAGMRQGTFVFVFETAADAHAARAILRTGQRFEFDHSAVPDISMTFVVAGGEVGVALGRASEWRVTVPFREVAP